MVPNLSNIIERRMVITNALRLLKTALAADRAPKSAEHQLSAGWNVIRDEIYSGAAYQRILPRRPYMPDQFKKGVD